MKRGLGTSGTTLNVPTNEGVPEGKEDDQEIENLLEKIMIENFPNLVKEIDIQVQEAQRIPKKLYPRRSTPRHIIITLAKIKDKEKNLKSSKIKGDSYQQRSAHETIS